MTEPKRRHLSDGAVEAMRADIASNRASGDVHKDIHIADNYVERALDEIAWLRWREGELELTISGKTFSDANDVRVAELEHSLADAMEQIEAIQGSNATHMAREAELEGESRDLQLKYEMALADGARHAKDDDLQAQLDRATKRTDELEEAALIALDRIAQVDTSLPLYVVAARNVLSHVLSDERRDEIITQIGILQAQLDRATSHAARTCLVCRGYAQAGPDDVKGEHHINCTHADRERELQSTIDGLKKPKPISSAPGNFTTVIIVHEGEFRLAYYSEANGAWLDQDPAMTYLSQPIEFWALPPLPDQSGEEPVPCDHCGVGPNQESDEDEQCPVCGKGDDR